MNPYRTSPAPSPNVPPGEWMARPTRRYHSHLWFVARGLIRRLRAPHLPRDHTSARGVREQLEVEALTHHPDEAIHT